MLYQSHLDTPLGTLTFVGSDAGLRAVLWPVERPGRVVFPEEPATSDHPVLTRAMTQVREYLDGHRRSFDVPLDLHGTPFQLKVWRALAAIPYGATSTYGHEAARLGDARKARALGAAVGRNPVSIILPCHRVVGTNGSLTGFAGGLEAKRHLLALEADAPA